MEEDIVETEKRCPLVLWKQSDLDKFVVTIRTIGILPLKSSKPHFAKNGSADVALLKTGMNVLAEVIDAKKKKKTIFTYEVVRFPSPIHKAMSHWKVEKDQIVISLQKKEPIDWMPFVNRRGLDQSSSSSSEDEYAAQGAAAPKPKEDRVLRLDDIQAGVQQLVIIERKAKESDSSDDDQR